MPSKKKSHSAKEPAARPVAEVLPQTHMKPVAERMAAGKALRERCSRKKQSQWQPQADRADPVDLLVENSRNRVEHLIPIRYGRMLANPFAFYRGAAAIMAYDLAQTPSTGLNIQICGDCHLLNFGGFATAERRLIFDLNDFDETAIAPWEWDIKRLAVSFVIAGQANGFAGDDSREAAWLAAQSYRQTVAGYTGMPVLEAWYDALDLNDIIDHIKDKQGKRFYTKKLAQATAESAHEKEFAKLAFASGNPVRIIDQPPLIFHTNDIRDEAFRALAEQSMADYLRSLQLHKRLLLNRYQLTDVAFKVVGVGSVGTLCGIALLMSGNGDPLFLQFKQARPSVLEPYAGASPFTHAGQRVVVGQRLMQAASDMFLGWFTGTGEHGWQFYMRQLKDAKIKPVVEVMNPENLKGYATLCGRALARAHARSGDAAVLSGYMGKSSAFEDALTDFSLAYADQNERDHAALVTAVRTGRIAAQVEA
ncbi:MAG: DUF2252 domain-containing protein [Anaerolineae bacterium]|nr:DUF2252 domain-containing protein [Anaerolineae bacterium]